MPVTIDGGLFSDNKSVNTAAQQRCFRNLLDVFKFDDGILSD